MQTGNVFKTHYAGYLEDSQSTSGGALCVFGRQTFVRVSWMCKKEISVSHSSTESEIIPWMQDERWTVYPHLTYCIWSSQFTETRVRLIKQVETCVRTKREVPTNSAQTSKMKEKSWIIWWSIHLFLQTWILLVRKLCCLRLKSTKQWSRWSQREEVPQWDIFPEPIELLLVGLFDRINLDPKSNSSTSTPKTNLPTS